MEDLDIIALFFARSEDAMHRTKEKYSRMLRSIIRRILPCPEDVEECENDTYFSAWQTIPPNRPANLKAYLAALARNQALRRYAYLHAEKRNPEMALSFDELAECLSDKSDGGIRYTDDELRDVINTFLGTLRPESRRVFLLRYWEFCSVKEIMQICSISKSKTESILFRTRHKLKKFLEERGYTE